MKDTWTDTTYVIPDGEIPMVTAFSDGGYAISRPGYDEGGGFSIRLDDKSLAGLISKLKWARTKEEEKR